MKTLTSDRQQQIGIDCEHPAMLAGRAALATAREQRAQTIAERLAARGFPGALQGALEQAGDSQVGRPHFASWMVREGHVAGWDDPRLPTLSGLRRRGYTPAAIRDFCERAGITKSQGVVEIGSLESTIREDLDRSAPRVMAVLRPLRLVIENYPDGESELLTAQNHPKDPEMGTREVPFSNTLYSKYPPSSWRS